MQDYIDELLEEASLEFGFEMDDDHSYEGDDSYL